MTASPPPPSRPRGHPGLARRVRALFETPPRPRGEAEPDAGMDVAWVAETGRPVAGAGASDPLTQAVEAYVLAGPGAGGEPAARLDREIALARQGPCSPSMVDAVEALLRYAVRDEVALDRARQLVTTEVAALLVRRLSEERDEGRRGRLLQQMPELGPEIRAATREALRTAPDPDGGGGDPGDGVLGLLAVLARSVPGILEEWVRDPDWRVVRAVVARTAERGGDETLQVLTVALAHDHPRVRRQTLAALRKLGGGEAGELALAMLGDEDRQVRAEAAGTVGALNVPRGAGALMEKLATEDRPEVLGAFLRALGELQDPQAVPELERWAQARAHTGGDPETRGAALEALHRIGTPYARRVVEAVAQDPVQRVRARAASLLEAWGTS